MLDIGPGREALIIYFSWSAPPLPPPAGLMWCWPCSWPIHSAVSTLSLVETLIEPRYGCKQEDFYFLPVPFPLVITVFCCLSSHSVRLQALLNAAFFRDQYKHMNDKNKPSKTMENSDMVWLHMPVNVYLVLCACSCFGVMETSNSIPNSNSFCVSLKAFVISGLVLPCRAAGILYCLRPCLRKTNIYILQPFLNLDTYPDQNTNVFTQRE